MKTCTTCETPLPPRNHNGICRSCLDHTSSARNAAILSLYREGAFYREIAAEVGCSAQWVRRVVCAAMDSMSGAERKAFTAKYNAKMDEHKRKPVRAARNVRIAAAYLDGAKIKDLATEFSLASPSICRILSEAGVYGANRAITRDPTYPERAIKLAAELAGANEKQLLSDWRRPKILVHARWAVMVGLRERGVSLPRIGARMFRDHSTVCHGLRSAEHLSLRSPEFAELVARVGAA
jgi:transposase-like protein